MSALALLLIITSPAAAELPVARLFSVFPPGGRVGDTVEVQLGGADLDEASELRFSSPGITATAINGNRFAVSIAPDVPEGIYEARVVGRFGVSNPRAFVVGHLEEVVEKESNNTVEQASATPLESVVNGRIDGGTDVDFFRVTAAKGQRVVVDCQAQGIDSVLDPIVAVLDASGIELAQARTARRKDPVLDFTAPADGDYFVRVHDVTYRGGNELFYRLSISTGAHIYFVHPPAGVPGTRTRYTVYGCNLPGGAIAPEVTIDGRPLERATVEIHMPFDPVARRIVGGALVESHESILDGMEYRLRTPRGASNPVFLAFTTDPVVLERESGDDAKAQPVLAPCEIAGQFYPARDVDRFEFEARKGDVFWIEVFSHRLGLPTDPHLVLEEVKRGENGEETVREIVRQDDAGGNIGGASFDTASDDVVYRFAAPSDGVFRITVNDLHATSYSDPRHQYRLSIRHEKPDFRLVAAPRYLPLDPKKDEPNVWSHFLRRGGVVSLTVLALRRDGFDGEILVSASGLPPGVVCRESVIPGGKHSTELFIEATDEAQAWSGEFRVTGRARIGDWDVRRTARAGSVVWPARDGLGPRSRVARDVALAVSGSEGVPLEVRLAEPVFEISRAGKLEIPLKLDRKTNFHGKLELTAYDLPDKVGASNISLDEKKKVEEAKLVLDVKKDAPPGTYTVGLVAAAELDYSRNPEAAERAKERKARVEAEAQELAAAAAQATEKRDAAVGAVQESETMVTRVTGELEAAKKAETELAAASAAAAAALEKAKADSEKSAVAFEAARKAADELAVKAKAATDARVEAEKALRAALEAEKAALAAATDASNKAESAAASLAAARKAVVDGNKAATESSTAAETAARDRAARATALEQARAKLAELTKARESAESALKEVAARVEQAKSAVDAAAKELKAAEDAAKPKKLKARFVAATITVKITDAPIVIEPSATTPLRVKQGGKAELGVTVTRRFGFEGPVTLTLAVPDVKGLKIPAVTIPEKETTATITVEAAPDTPTGPHAARLGAKVSFNKQELETGLPITVTVERS